MGLTGTSSAWAKRAVGRCGIGLLPLHQCCLLVIAYWLTVARFAAGIWQMGNLHQRFIRWRDKRIWEKLLEILIDDPDFEWLMIDASHCKVHPHAAGARGGNQGMGRTKGDSTVKYTWLWMRMVCRSELLLQRVPQRIAHKP